ncbi:MAG: glycosyltransferase family 2 protein [Bdellovibrionota bacterium]
MTKTPRIALVLLTWNEFEGTRELLRFLANPASTGVDEVLAIDGGSTDGTLEEFRKHGILVHTQSKLGRGQAMREAVALTDADYLIFFSPDGNEDWRDISKFRSYFEQEYDLVIASRMMDGALNEEDHRWIRHRKWANNVFNIAANLFFRRSGPFVTDSINGFRGVRRQLFKDLAIDEVRYTVEYQMTIRSFKQRKRIVEFPTREGQRIGGETKAPSVRTGLSFLGCLYKEFLTPG